MDGMGGENRYPYGRRARILVGLVPLLVTGILMVAIGLLLLLHPRVPGFIKVGVLVWAALMVMGVAYALAVWRFPRFRAVVLRLFKTSGPTYQTFGLKLAACLMVFSIVSFVLTSPIWILAALPEPPNWVGFLVAVPTVVLAVLGGLWSAYRMYRAEIWRSVRTYLEEHYRALWK